VCNNRVEKKKKTSAWCQVCQMHRRHQMCQQLNLNRRTVFPPQTLQPCTQAPLAIPLLQAHPVQPNNKPEAKCHLHQSCCCRITYQLKVSPLPIPVLCPQSPAMLPSLFWATFRSLHLWEVGRHKPEWTAWSRPWLCGSALPLAPLLPSVMSGTRAPQSQLQTRNFSIT